MILRDFRIGWRLLVKEPAYSAVVILGLAVGFATCFLLFGYVVHSFSYDRELPQRAQVYRLMQHWNIFAGARWGDGVSLPARDAILASGQPLLASAMISRDVDVRIGNAVQTMDVSVVDPAFREIFQPKVLAGDLAATLVRPDALALTRETALKLFGSLDVVGKTIGIAGQSYQVGALLEDQPAATTLPYAALAGTRTSIWNAEYRELVSKNWGSSHGRVYVKLLPGADGAQALAAVRRSMLASSFYQRQSPDQIASLNGRDMIDFRLGSLADAYLDPLIKGSNPVHGERKTIFGLAAVGLLILVLAATNYVNLATVRMVRRQREIAVRKVLGAGAGAVSRHFLAESVLVCLVATVIGLLLAWLLLPVFADLVQRKLDHIFNPLALIVGLALGVLVGVLAGVYPAWSAIKVRPTAALAGRGNSETSGGLRLRRILTVLQFATAMALTAVTLGVAWQTRYASNLDPGFDPGPLLIVETADDMRNSNVSAFRDALARIPGVSGVAVSNVPMTTNNNSNSMKREGGTTVSVNWFRISPDFFGVYGLKPVAGRLYDAARDRPADENKIVINEAAVRALGFSSAHAAAGKSIDIGNGNIKQVIGVVPDIRHVSAREEPQPALYRLGLQTGVFTVRTAERERVQHAIEALWPRYFPNDVLQVQRMTALFSQNYADDLRLAKLLAASSVIATAIAAFGIYVLAAYSVQCKAREIVLRKLYGAGGAAIGRLVAREFLVLIGIGALVGLPLAYVALQRYLASFTEQAPVGAWTLGAALLVSLLVALGSTVRHGLGAMRIRPVLALRE